MAEGLERRPQPKRFPYALPALEGLAVCKDAPSRTSGMPRHRTGVPVGAPLRRGASYLPPEYLVPLCALAKFAPNPINLKSLILLVPGEGLEPPTNGLQNRCSTAELTRPYH